MSRSTLQSVLALPMCVFQLIVLAEMFWDDDDPSALTHPAVLAGVAVIWLFGMYALRASIRSDPSDETIGRGRFILVGLVVMLASDISSVIRLVSVLSHVGPIMMCGPTALTVMIGGRMIVTTWNLGSRLRHCRQLRVAFQSDHVPQ